MSADLSAMRRFREAFDHDGNGEQRIAVECDREKFDNELLPYAIGYAGSTHGLADVRYPARREGETEYVLTFKRHTER